ncbi:MAG: HPr(Ser) kinase/phosphatase [Chthoniobacterales bacterium]|nr:HPr(Ser) kinase/phosphatase [Chthoniobacterales bacterium]
MPTQQKFSPEPLTVGQFFATYAKRLGLRLASSARGLNRIIREPTINRPGLALAGFFHYFPAKRIQVFGASEMSYLRSLPEKTAQERVRALFERNFPCAVIARDSRIPPWFLQIAEANSTPLFRTAMITMKFTNAATLALEAEFAPQTSEHGSMVDIMGIGTLIRGPSGIGKSECVLGLIERGYSLVSDDITRFRLVDGREIVGMSSELSRFHMEVRGIGIINVAAIFGVGAVRAEKRLDLVATLEDWDKCDDLDRTGLTSLTYEILGIPIPHVIIPVRTGRDLARLVEVAALDQKLKSMGYHSALEFNQRLLQLIRQDSKQNSQQAPPTPTPNNTTQQTTSPTPPQNP